MGRPLNKKYFGNRNIGTGGYEITGPNSNRLNYGDDRIGGEGVASAAVTVAGSFTTRPSFTFTAPQLPGGVTAAGTITARAKTGTVGGPITIAYLDGEVVSSVGGTTWTVTKEAEQSVTISSTDNGGAGSTGRIILSGAITAVKGANFLTGGTISGGGLSANTQYYIKTGGTGTTFEITDTYAKAVAGTGITLTGPGAVTNGGVGIGSVYAPVASVAVANKGDFPATGGALSTSANATTSTTGSGAGLTVAINAYEGKAVVITEKGSGYSAAPTVDGYTNRGGITVNTIVLSTDTGAVGSATNQENAIVLYANVTGSGSTGAVCDIIRQVSTNRYKVTDGTYTKIVQLGTDASPEDGEAYIVATATGGTYFVTKLTSRKATLVTKTGDGALNGKSVPWSFDAGTATTVQIENA